MTTTETTTTTMHEYDFSKELRDFVGSAIASGVCDATTPMAAAINIARQTDDAEQIERFIVQEVLECAFSNRHSEIGRSLHALMCHYAEQVWQRYAPTF